jgi:hypothetical protein
MSTQTLYTQGEGGFPSTQRYYRRFLLFIYKFRSYDHLQAEIYLLELTLLTTDSLFLNIS